MVQVGHARLLAALIAAISLHALLLLDVEESGIAIDTRAGYGAIDVALVTPKTSTRPPVSVSSTEAARAKEHAHPKQQEILVSELALERLPQQQDRPPHEAAMLRPDGSSASPLAAAVPARIEATILANVVYPRAARRRGWQGQAELGFDVSGQSVQRVTLLASSGYSILDQAARNGLISVSSLPLNDGSYRLPVVFRLQ